MTTQNLLVELFVEELPPKALKKLGEAFAAALAENLVAQGADEFAVSQLRRAADGKNEALFHDSIAPGTTLADGLQRALEAAMAKLPIPKVMQYQLADGWSSVHFVRPVHGLVALHGTDIVPVSVLGLTAGRDTQGHRFEARVCPVSIQSADSYASQMED